MIERTFGEVSLSVSTQTSRTKRVCVGFRPQKYLELLTLNAESVNKTNSVSYLFSGSSQRRKRGPI